MSNEINVELSAGKKKLVIAACIIMYFNYMVINLGCGVALPKLLTEIDAMSIYAVVTVFSSVGLMIASPVAGKLSDTLGRKWLTIISLAAYLLCVAGGGLATAGWVLLVCWGLSGICGGFFISAAFSIIADVTTMKERPKFYGYLATAAAVGMLAGPLLAGVFADAGVPRAAYFIGIPLGIVVIVIYILCYPNKKFAVNPGGRVDVPGLVLLVVSLCSLVAYLNFGNVMFSRTSALGIGLLAVGIVGLVVLVYYEYRAQNPVISVRLFRYKEFRVAWICHLLFTMYVVTASAYIVLFAQQVMKVSATVSSTLSMPQTICSAVLSSFVGVFIGKNIKNYRWAYMVMGLCGAVPLLLWGFCLKPDSSTLLIYGMTLLGGVGYACDQVINTPYLQTTMPKENYGAAQGMIAFAGSAGGTICGAIAGAFLNSGAPMETSLSRIYLFFGVCLVVIFVMGITLKPGAVAEKGK
ncbi:MAG: MFS transporter [Blautia sp.]|jgi:MFS family permease